MREDNLSKEKSHATFPLGRVNHRSTEMKLGNWLRVVSKIIQRLPTMLKKRKRQARRPLLFFPKILPKKIKFKELKQGRKRTTKYNLFPWFSQITLEQGQSLPQNLRHLTLTKLINNLESLHLPRGGISEKREERFPTPLTLHK